MQLLKKIQASLRQQEFESVLKHKQFRIEDALVIATAPRSGSTWLMELLQHIPRVATLFEPFSDPKDTLGASARWGKQASTVGKDVDEQAWQDLEAILTLQNYSPWTCRSLSSRVLRNSDRVLIKLVRATHLLPTLLHRVQFSNPPVWLLRHPIDTASSQLKLHIPTHYIDQLYEQHASLITSLDGPLERQIAIWCINNLLPAKLQPTSSQIQLICYEDLISNPEEVFSNILGHYQLPVPAEELLSKMNFRQASKTDFNKQLRTSADEQLSKNIDKLSHSQLRNIQQIFDYFGLRLYQADSPYPQVRQLPISQDTAHTMPIS